MALVIAVVGAGGKSTFIEAAARRFAAQGKCVAVTTTTHIWAPGGGADAVPGVRYYGRPAPGGKLSYPGDREYAGLCRTHDVVLAECDGAHFMPMKIPAADEPAVPQNADEIVVVTGLHAAGRPLGAVCQRFGLLDAGRLPPEYAGAAAGTAVTEGLLRAVAEAYYLAPLRARFPAAKVRLELSDPRRSGLDADVGRVLLVLMAAGYGRRFGSNKLLAPCGGEPLYRHALRALCEAAGLLEREFSSRPSPLAASVAVVTRYEEIAADIAKLPRPAPRLVWNGEAEEGIAASVRAGCRAAREDGADAAVYFAADQPFLDGAEIARFVTEFLCSGKSCGCMLKEKQPANPGAFRLRGGMEEKLLGLRGDRGGMRLISEAPSDVCYYPVLPAKLRDVDTPGDLPAR